MNPRLLAAGLVLPLLLAACGGEDEPDGEQARDDETSVAPTTSTPEDSTSPTEATSSDTAPPGGGELTAEDEAAIEETMVAVLLEPRCDLLTDEYVVEVGIDDDATPTEACEQYEALFVEPVYTEDDILLSNLASTGDGVATIEVGSEHVNITTLYELTLDDGTWKVSGDEYNSDI